MLCEACQKNGATVHWTKVVNDKKTELHLCTACAQESGLQPSIKDIPEMLGSFIAGILAESQEASAPKARKKTRRQQRKCPECGSTYALLEKKGLLGCARCYDTFADELKILLRRVHGNYLHKGRQPRAYGAVSSKATVEKLRRELQEAIMHEKFERAAELRNLIRASEVGLKPKSDQ
ncbi:MAG: UvrB/UvrC motif-containing protein [bacterium]